MPEINYVNGITKLSPEQLDTVKKALTADEWNRVKKNTKIYT